MRAAPARNEEWAFIPASLPTLQTGERFVVRLAAGTHYVTRIDSGRKREGIPYSVADENILRQLKTAGGGTRSAYGPEGFINASRRGERFLFWPMGISSAGTMRQWGKHATAFVGRRHFDDANLVDLRFAIVE